MTWGGLHRLTLGTAAPRGDTEVWEEPQLVLGPWALGLGSQGQDSPEPSHLTSSRNQPGWEEGEPPPPHPPYPRRALPLLPGVPLLPPGRTPSPRGQQLSLGADLGLRLWAPSAFSLPCPPLPPKGVALPALPGQLPSPFPGYL